MLGGSSPKTGYAGSITIALAILELTQSAIATEGMPSSKFGWMALVLGVAARLAKDADKTNSQHPLADSVTVPAVSASPVTVPKV
jgi:hypothetical protein